MTHRPSHDAASLPAIHAVHLAELVARWGVTAEALLNGTALQLAALSQPGCRLPVTMFSQLVERARTLTGEPALGITFGMQMRISWHGYLGLAAMTSQNLRQAIEVATRFVPTLTGALALSLELEGSTAALVIHECTDFGVSRDAIIFALVVGLWQLGCTLTGQKLSGRAELALPEPSYVGRWKGVMPGALRFDQPEHRLLFDASELALPLVTADPAALLLTREQCERELDALGFEGPFRDRVSALVLHGSGGVRTLAEVAAQLHTSARTLKRRLAELGTSYSEIRDAARQRRSLTLLRTTSLPLDEIADRLGYTDVANFGRAFRRWTGRTPGAIRQGGEPLS